MRVDISKPQPNHIWACPTQGYDGLDRYFCEACEWETQRRQADIQARINRQWERHAAADMVIGDLDDRHLKALNAAIRASKNVPGRVKALTELREMVERLASFGQDISEQRRLNAIRENFVRKVMK